MLPDSSRARASQLVPATPGLPAGARKLTYIAGSSAFIELWRSACVKVRRSTLLCLPIFTGVSALRFTMAIIIPLRTTLFAQPCKVLTMRLRFNSARPPKFTRKNGVQTLQTMLLSTGWLLKQLLNLLKLHRRFQPTT